MKDCEQVDSWRKRHMNRMYRPYIGTCLVQDFACCCELTHFSLSRCVGGEHGCNSFWFFLLVCLDRIHCAAVGSGVFCGRSKLLLLCSFC